jgi:gamma-glutamyl-gamma-aminobutyrate hydrolase PuuD
VLHFAIEDDLLIYGSLDEVGPEFYEDRHEIVVMQFCPTTQKWGRQVVMNIIEEQVLVHSVQRGLQRIILVVL